MEHVCGLWVPVEVHEEGRCKPEFRAESGGRRNRGNSVRLSVMRVLLLGSHSRELRDHMGLKSGFLIITRDPGMTRCLVVQTGTGRSVLNMKGTPSSSRQGDLGGGQTV